MPTQNNQKSLQIRIKSVIITILFFIICVTLFVVMFSLKKKEDKFLPTYYYFVYVGKYKKQSMLFTQKEGVKKNGWASVIYKHKNYYYLLLNVYTEKSEADAIASELEDLFSNVSVVRISTSKISKNIKNTILKDFEVKNALKYLEEYINHITQYLKNCLSSEVLVSDIISEIVNYKLMLNGLKSRLVNSQSYLGGVISSYIDRYLNIFDDFLHKFYTQANNRRHLICKISIELILTKIEMINNIAG